MKKILSIIYIYNIDIESKIENKKINKIISIFLKVKSKIKNKKINKIISIFLKKTFIFGIIILYFYIYIKNFKNLEIFEFIYNISYIERISSDRYIYIDKTELFFLYEKINLQDYKIIVKKFKQIYNIEIYDKKKIYGLDINNNILYEKDFEKIEENKDLIKKKILENESLLLFLLSLQNRKDLIKLFKEMKNQLLILSKYFNNQEIKNKFLENINLIKIINNNLEKIPLSINTDSYQEYIKLLYKGINFEDIKKISIDINKLLTSIKRNYKNILYNPILNLVNFLSNQSKSNNIFEDYRDKQDLKNIFYIFLKKKKFYSSLLKMLENKNNEQNNQEEKKELLRKIKIFSLKKFGKLNSIIDYETCYFPFFPDF